MDISEYGFGFEGSGLDPHPPVWLKTKVKDFFWKLSPVIVRIGEEKSKLTIIIKKNLDNVIPE